MGETANDEKLTFVTNGPADTKEFARELAAACRPDDVIGLCGTLGSGKTTLVKGLARGLSVDETRQVISPTFMLMRSYPGRLDLHHFDAYRLSGGDEMDAIGAEEVFASGGVSVVEWADHVEDCLPPDHFVLRITVEGAERRRFELSAMGQQSRSRLQEFGRHTEKWQISPA